MANLELGDIQQVTATVVPDDADNQPTTDTLTWTASVETAVTLQPSADTLSCVILGAVRPRASSSPRPTRTASPSPASSTSSPARPPA
jgi:hypothetical protein